MGYKKERVHQIYQMSEMYGEEKAASLLGISLETVKRESRRCRQMLHELDAQYTGKAEPNILLFDIENAPSLAWIWSLWNEVRDYKFIFEEWYLLCFAWKWLGGDTVCHALPDFKEYKKNPKSDTELLKILHGLFDKADIIIAHNCDKFDIRKVNARFVMAGMKPPSPYKTVDTLKVAKRHFMFTSNRLDALGELLGLGRKIDTGGFELWEACMNGDREAWDLMVEYNCQDVDLLEKVYLRLRPYMNNHPNFNVYTDHIGLTCPCCGAQVVENGYAYTNVSRFIRYQCTNCSYWGRGRTSVLDKEKKKSIISNVST